MGGSAAFNVAFIGMAGVGKSSLVRQVCTESNDTVSHQNEIEIVPYTDCVHNWTVYNFPGYGTALIPDLERFFAQALTHIHIDMVVLCVGPRVYQQDNLAYALMDSFRLVPLAVARTRCDIFPCDMFQVWRMRAQSFPKGTIFPVSTNDKHEAHRYIALMTDYVDWFLKNPTQ